MKKCLGVVADGFNTIRTGRANPAILDKIMVGARGGRNGSVRDGRSTEGGDAARARRGIEVHVSPETAMPRLSM